MQTKTKTQYFRQGKHFPLATQFLCEAAAAVSGVQPVGQPVIWMVPGSTLQKGTSMLF